MLRRERLNRRGLRSVPAPRRARRLRIDGKNAMPGIEQRTQNGRGESRRTEENEIERPSWTGDVYLGPLFGVRRQSLVPGCVWLWRACAESSRV